MALANDRMARLGELLDQSLPLGPRERRAWFDALTGEDGQLMQGLRDSLLAEDPSTMISGPLDQPPRIDDTDAAGMGGIARQAGERFGAYELLRPLGAGGMAEVWLARRADGAFERQVALKIPRLRGMPAEMAERFARECRILASLEYPGIARLYDAGVDASGVPYIAMEYVKGEALVDWCDARKLDAAMRIRLFMQVLDAVSYAHQRHVLHRDLKPSNILVTEHGEARLLDFGVARLLQGDAGRPGVRHAWGSALTPGYASPELLRGEALDLRSDVYSLGVLLHELLTGSRPVLGRQLSGIASGLHGSLCEVLIKALAPLPADRYADTATFAAALRPFAGTGGLLPAHGRIRHLAAAIAALAIAGAFLWYQRDATPATRANTGPVPIAVLPFENFGAPAQAHRALGFAETLSGHLEHIPGLQMIGPESTFAFNGTTEGAGSIAQQLRVHYLLRGSFFGDGPTLRISARLIDGRDNTVVMERDYAQPVEQEIRAVLDAIARDVAQALAVKLDVEMLAQDEGGTSNLAAADLYWRWRQFVLQDGPANQDIDALVSALRQAVDLDPGFLLARDALASALNGLANRLERRAAGLEEIASSTPSTHSDHLRREAAQLRADAASNRSQAEWTRARLEQLAPDSWLVWRDQAYAAALTEHWEEAENLARKVYGSRPLTLEKIKPLGDILFAMGRVDETIKLEDQEGQLEPLSMWISRNQQYNYFAAGRAGEAEAEYQRSKIMSGNRNDLEFLAFIRLVAQADADPAELRRRYPPSWLQQGAPQLQFNRDFHAVLGDRQRMGAVVRRAFESGQHIGHLMADAVGERDVAMAAFLGGWDDRRHKDLSRAYWNLWLMPNSGVRAHPEFKDLVRRIGLYDYWRKSNKWADFCHPRGADDFECG